MTELVFYDQRLPLKRKWSDHHAHQQPSPSPPRPLPRLPSLADWAPVKPAPAAPLSILTPPPRMSTTTSSSPGKRELSSSSSASSPPKAKPHAPMRNTSRERMKAEQAALRAQAATLETELSCLRQLRHERLARALHDRASSDERSEAEFGWQEMAQRHWEQRVASERENKRLREAVNGLATEVKSLESLFNSRSSALMASLRQNAQLAVQVQELLSGQDESAHHSPRAAKQSPAAQQSPRDVACAMEAPRFSLGGV